MVDTKYIGKKYPPVTYEVGKEKIREYATAVGDTNPLYLDDEKAKAGPYSGIIAPPMFAVVYAGKIAGSMLLDSDLALNMLMLLHGEQEFEFGVPVRPGDTITTEGFIKDIYSKKGKDFVVFGSESKNQKGEMTVQATWTFVIRGA